MIREPRSVPLRPVPARTLLSGGLAALLLAVGASALAADVSFRQAFDAAAGQDVMVVTVPDSDVLVFDAGSYYTQGKRLIVVAARARLAGETRVGFYPPNSRPPAKSDVAATGPGGPPGAHHSCGRSGCPGNIGQPGATGAPGDDGAPASSLLFDIADLQGDGKLILVATGQAGGKGQQGGKGGTGGRGGNGAERSCGGAFGLDTRAGPGDGGRGGQAGPGGKGGPGGRGGAGGSITLSANLFPSLVKGHVVIERQPAQGGPGGDPGAAGDPGSGGGMGGGNSCGGGGSTGGGGAANIAGATGDPGPWGSQGSLRYWLGNESGAAGAVTLPVKQKLGVAVAPEPKDCVAVTPILLDVKIPDGHVIVRVDAVQVLQLQGVVGFIEPPVMRPVGNLGRYEVATVLERQVSADPQVMIRPEDSGTPLISLNSSCPALLAQFEASFEVAPMTGALGATLAPPPGLKAVP